MTRMKIFLLKKYNLFAIYLHDLVIIYFQSTYRETDHKKTQTHQPTDSQTIYHAYSSLLHSQRKKKHWIFKQYTMLIPIYYIPNGIMQETEAAKTLET